MTLKKKRANIRKRDKIGFDMTRAGVANRAQGAKTKIKKDDMVRVISGAHAGQEGRVIEVLKSKGRVRVEGIAPIKRHLAPQKNPRHPEGGIIEGAGSLHISNVMLISEALDRPVRVGASVTAEGKKLRVARGRNLKAEEV